MYIETLIVEYSSSADLKKIQTSISAKNRFLLKKRNDELLICLTLYNEPAEALLLSLFSVAKAIELLYNKEGTSNKVTVCIIADGQENISPSTNKLIDRLNIRQNSREFLEINLADHLIKINAIYSLFYELNSSNSFPNEWTTIYSTWERNNDTQSCLNISDYDFRIILCSKKNNQGKLNSHWWFFEIICENLDPKYCFQLDAGTAPDVNSINIFWNFMQQNTNVGAAASRVMVPATNKYFNLLQSWQYGDFVYQKLFDWPAEVVSGYLTVIPGQFCIFRYKALKIDLIKSNRLLDKQQNPLDFYFRGLKDLNTFQSNMFLAEDRILGFEIISKGINNWKLAYVADAVSTTDSCNTNTMLELFHQRRRWINSSFFCNLWLVVKIGTFLKNSHLGFFRKIHMVLSVPWLITNNLTQLLYPSILLIIMKITFEGINLKFNIYNNYLAADTIVILIFILLVIFQIFIFIKKTYLKRFINIIKVTAVLQSLLLFSGILIYGIQNHSISHNNILLFSVFIAESLSLVLMSFYYAKNMMKDLINNILQYFIVRPIMLLMLTSYSFCNVHDYSWGTKGLSLTNQELKISLDKNKYNNKVSSRFRLITLISWAYINIIIVTFVFLTQNRYPEKLMSVFMYFLIGFIGFKLLSGILFIIKDRINKTKI